MLKVLEWVGIGLAFLVAFVIGELIQYKIHYHIYDEGRTPTQRRIGQRFQLIGIAFFVVMLAANWRHKVSSSGASLFVFWAAFAGAMYCALRAGAVTSMRRTLAAFAAVIVGFALLVWGVVIPAELLPESILISAPARGVAILLGTDHVLRGGPVGTPTTRARLTRA